MDLRVVIHLPEGRLPQAQASPEMGWFSVTARSQVHWPAGREPIRIILASIRCRYSDG